MANPTNPFNWQMPTSTDLVTDLPADFETFGQAVATSMADLLGGTTGQVLSKASNTDMDFTWVAQDDSNAIQNAIVDAKGDLIGATAADTPARLAVGTNGQVLTADSTAATGLAWATPATNTTLTQIANGTLSGANLTFTGLTQDTLILQVNNPTWSSTNANVYCRLNGDTSAKYTNSIAEQIGSTTDYDFATSTASASVFYGNRQAFGNGTGFLNYVLVLRNCKATGKTQMYSKVIYLTNGSAKAFGINDGVYTADAQITSLTWLSGFTLTGGTYTLWGA